MIMAGQFRIGYGYDVHRLVEGRRCVIGGVEIESALGCSGTPTPTCSATR